MFVSEFFPIHMIIRLTSIGTMIAFSFVSIGVMVMRFAHPNLVRPFKCPALFIVAPLAVLGCAFLVYNLLKISGLLYLGWLSLGLIFYLFYGRKKLAKNS